MKDRVIINDIKMMALDMINNANSGHPGIVLGNATTLYTLYREHLCFNVLDPTWINRDRFVLSAGHGSSLLYSLLFASGYNYELEDLKHFRKINSITPGHPEYNPDLGIEMTTGPLGQGVATAVGMAMAEKYLESFFGKKIIDYKIYVLCGDGDLMEGVSYEALSLASNYNLNNLILLYDQNHITLDGALEKSYNENINLRFKALNFQILEVKNGENIVELDRALSKAKLSKRPVLIKINNIIGRYSKNQNTNKVHGSPLEKSDLENIRSLLTDNKLPFGYHEEEYLLFREYIKKRNQFKYDTWMKNYQALDEEKKCLVDSLINRKTNFSSKKYSLENISVNQSMRNINHDIMNMIKDDIPFILGGSADTASSTKTYLEEEGDFSSSHYRGKNIYFGVREHACGAIVNGLTLSNIYAFGSTFLTFSDYMRPSIRNAALMNIPSLFIFTHDTLNIGQDGPTHQPVEQLNSLRMIPNLEVYRPCNKEEIMAFYDEYFKKIHPSVLVLSREEIHASCLQKVDISKGAYIFSKEEEKLDFTIIATGSEVEVALEIKKELNNPNIRIVSAPNLKRFIQQKNDFKEKILPTICPILGIEYGNDLYLRLLTNHVIGINTFGESGTKEQVIKKYKLDVKNILKYVKENF